MGQETILDEEKRVTQSADLQEETTGKHFGTGTFLQRLSKEVAPSLGSIPLLACCFATGLTDGTLYNGEDGLEELNRTWANTPSSIRHGGVIDGSYPSQRDPNDVDFTELAPIALLSFQAAGQIVNSRGLGMGEVPTVVITSLLCDLVSDENVLAPLKRNVKRNRRAIAFVLTLAGAICGGWLSKATGAVQPSLWFVACIKGLIVLYWFNWRYQSE
ncbi:hypothetical protein SLS62_009386 [Diatrype stigma]|uniref:Uncharacterized protein n=1 Tax=Diatrype stigma TaxID=117547 RepID=A0AAN9YIR6_9PEZI